MFGRSPKSDGLPMISRLSVNALFNAVPCAGCDQPHGERAKAFLALVYEKARKGEPLPPLPPGNRIPGCCKGVDAATEDGTLTIQAGPDGAIMFHR
jgi:hypothetical protein